MCTCVVGNSIKDLSGFYLRPDIRSYIDGVNLIKELFFIPWRYVQKTLIVSIGGYLNSVILRNSLRSYNNYRYHC